MSLPGKYFNILIASSKVEILSSNSKYFKIPKLVLNI